MAYNCVMLKKISLIALILLIAPLGLMGSSAAPAISDLAADDFIVRLHPENELFVGDLISFEPLRGSALLHHPAGHYPACLACSQ